MLRTFTKGACVFAAATTLWAGTAVAGNHTVYVMDGAYFPTTIYARPGDNVIFVNQSGTSHVVNSTDESWTSGDIEVDASFRLNLTSSTTLEFSGEGPGGEEMVGNVTYDAAPLEEN